MADETQQPTLEDRIANLQSQIDNLNATVAKLYGQSTDTDPKPATVTAGESANYGHPALLRRLEKHGIRLHPEDMDDFNGSGSEKYNAATDWTKDKGEGRTFPGLPTQAQADAAVAQGI